jgi:hypothetical protein
MTIIKINMLVNFTFFLIFFSNLKTYCDLQEYGSRPTGWKTLLYKTELVPVLSLLEVVTQASSERGSSGRRVDANPQNH